MGPHSDSLAATVMREAEEELQWAREKSRPSPLLTASGTSGSFDFPSPSMTPMPMHPSMDVESGSGSALPFAPGLRGAGSVFLTKYGRGRSGSEPSMSPRRSPATESPDKSTFHVVRRMPARHGHPRSPPPKNRAPQLTPALRLCLVRAADAGTGLVRDYGTE